LTGIEESKNQIVVKNEAELRQAIDTVPNEGQEYYVIIDDLQANPGDILFMEE